MNKRILCGLLSCVLLCGAQGPIAYAAEEAAEDSVQILIKALDFRDVDADCAAEDGSWQWDAGSHVLTLKHLRVQVPAGKLEEQAAIMLPADSVLDVEGRDNSIDSGSVHCSGVYCEGDLFVSGDGYLEISLKSYGSAAFYSERGPITFDERVEIAVKPAGYVLYVKDAKERADIISVQDEASITFPDRYADSSVTILHDGDVVENKDWTDYAKQHDLSARSITLLAKDRLPLAQQSEQETAEPETDGVSSYQMTIGSTVIRKDGVEEYDGDAAPYLSNGYTMLPLRALLAVTDPDLEIKWNAATQTAYVFIDQQMLSVRAGEDFYRKASQKIALATPAELKNGRLFLSLRDWMRMMDLDEGALEWDSQTQSVTLRR